ncbi:RNA-dependent RNA polymerase [Stagonosporopsis vannaccii]|nr:RNA-dependent RNA polymerase [Stagonosporopsis vannaccii]
MRRLTNNRPQSGYRGYDRRGEGGSSDGCAHSTSSSGSERQAGLHRPVLNLASNPFSRMSTPEQPRAVSGYTGLSTRPATPVREVSSFTLNGQHISETYKHRSSMDISPSKPLPPEPLAMGIGSPRHRAHSQHIPNTPVTHKTRGHWALNQEMKLKVFGIPKRYWTKDVYFTMSRFGTVIKIEMEVGSHDNNAWVIFQPPAHKRIPTQLYIDGNHVRFEVRESSTFTVQSPVNPAKQYQEINILRADSLIFGVQTGEMSLLNMHEVHTNGEVQISLNLRRMELEVQFPLYIDDRSHEFSFRLPIPQLTHIYKTEVSPSLIIPFERPPQFFTKKKPTKEDDSLFPDNERTWSVWNTMFRETDVVDDHQRRAMQMTALIDYKDSAIIDIGRWTVYRLSFNNYALSGSKFEEFRGAIDDFGVTMHNCEQFTTIKEKPPPLSDLLGEDYTGLHSHLNARQRVTSILDDLSFNRIHLPFHIRYQLEACLSNGFIKENSVTREFLQKLESMNPHQAVHILEKVVDKQLVFYDPMEIFNIRSKVTCQRPIPKHCVMQRSVNITPTMMHVASPVMEISNRITRQYLADADRFIRVKFSDEKGEGALRTLPGGRADALFNRVSCAMRNGIIVAGRYYEFLAFGNSQFREHGAYFYSPSTTKSAHDIRVALGQFDHIKTVAKYGARLGQCFSTTRAMQTTVRVHKLPDIERNGYTFTDGVGKLSLFLAQMAAQDLGLQNAFDDPPSLYQFRLGGCKGVLALDPAITKNEVHIRPSQSKFEAPYTGLEIIRCSSLATPFFNRQIIIVLSDLGVPDYVFIRKQQQMVNAYELAMLDKSEALSCLLKHVDINQITLTMASMVVDGFLDTREPFMMSLLHLWRACTIKDLKKKARIAIEQGAFVLGCVDESGTLKGHRNDPQSRVDVARTQKLETLPQIFIQIDDTNRKGHYTVIEGTCVLARNPSLHPGDIRVVRAINVPALHHHKNVVVLPQHGDRDLASMCSGGDLDGDDYMVLWDQDLIPSLINVPPMEYTPEKPIEKAEPIDISDVSDFFVTYMKNDSLGQIAHAHLAQADQQPHGVISRACIELAKLHSQAVDYPKSGVPAIMDKALRPKKWPHYMEKRYKSASQIYHSKNILGMLYDQVQLVDFKPLWASNFDQRILDAFEVDKSSLVKATQIKAEYDEDLKKLMAKHGIQTEFEAFTTFVLAHNQDARDYKFAEELGRTVGILKSHYRGICLNASGATSIVDWDRLGPFVAAMYSVTAEEMRNALKECNETKVVEAHLESLRKTEAGEMPFMSFPWLFHTQLGKLATGGTRPDLRAKPQQDYPAISTEKVEGSGSIEIDGDITRLGEKLNLDFGDVQTIEQREEKDAGDHEEMESLRNGSPTAALLPSLRP